jgi:hypothetical protein
MGAAMLLALTSQHSGFCSVYCVVGRQIKAGRYTVKHQKRGTGGEHTFLSPVAATATTGGRRRERKFMLMTLRCALVVGVRALEWRREVSEECPCS